MSRILKGCYIVAEGHLGKADNCTLNDVIKTKKRMVVIPTIFLTIG